MKPIKIALRFRPFSHLPGTAAVIPCTDVQAKVYPSRIELASLKGNFYKAIPLALNGPVKKFTVMQDLEARIIRVFGYAKEGFFRYFLKGEGNEIILKNEKREIPIRDMRFAFYGRSYVSPHVERLSLGIHKVQDVQSIYKRKDMREILPIWFQLSQLIPIDETNGDLGRICEEKIRMKSNWQLLDGFLAFYLSAFSGIFSPNDIDPSYLGFREKEYLGKSKDLIRMLFYASEGDIIQILPLLPSEFHAGRMLSVKEKGAFTLDMEWTKGMIRRMVVYAEENRIKQFVFQKCICNYRLRESAKGMVTIHKNGDVLSLEKGKTYFFDRFEK